MVHSPKNSPCMLDPKGNNFQLGTGNIWRCMTCSKGQFSCFSCLFGDITLIFAWEAPLRQISRWKGTIVLLYWRKRGDSLNWKSMKAWRTYQYHLTQASMAGNLQAVLARMKWTTTHSGYNYLQAILKSSKESWSKKDFWCMLYSLCQLANTKKQLPKNRLCAQGRILKNYIFGACTCNELDQNMVFDVRSVHETWTELLQAQAESQSQVCKSLTQPPHNYHRLRSIQKNGYDVFNRMGPNSLNHTKRNANFRFIWNSEVLEVRPNQAQYWPFWHGGKV